MRYFRRSAKYMIVVERDKPPTEEEWVLIIKELE